MTIRELSAQYWDSAAQLKERIAQLKRALPECVEEEEALRMEARIRMLATMMRETRELASLTEHYYERGYYRNERYTL